MPKTAGPPTTRRLDAFESQGERRRRQLLEIASHLTITEGLHAVRIPRIAELAGCTRTLVYRYFKTREEILAALVSTFDEEFESHIGSDGIAAGLKALAEPEDPQKVDQARRFLVDLAEFVEARGAAGLIIVGTPRIRNELGDFGEAVFAAIEQRWILPLLELGLSRHQAQLFWEVANAITRMSVLGATDTGQAEEADVEETRIVMSAILSVSLAHAKSPSD